MKEAWIIFAALLAIVMGVFIELRTEIRSLSEQTVRLEERMKVVQEHCCGELNP